MITRENFNFKFLIKKMFFGNILQQKDVLLKIKKSTSGENIETQVVCYVIASECLKKAESTKEYNYILYCK